MSAMQDDVERVARAIRKERMVSTGTSSQDAEQIIALDPKPTQSELAIARAAMAATLELAAEALRTEAMCLPNTHTACTHKHADWLQQCAKDVANG